MSTVPGVGERVNLGIAGHAPGRRDHEDGVSRLRASRFGDAAQDPESELRGAFEKESFGYAAGRLRRPGGVHRETAREHLGEDRETGALLPGEVEMPGQPLVVLGRVLPGDVELDERYAQNFSSLCAASFSVSSFLQNAKRTNDFPSADS